MSERIVQEKIMPKDIMPKSKIPDNFTVIDLETTGLNPKTEKIIEIGAVRVRDGVVTEQFTTLVNPGRKLEERIIELTGICDKDLETAPFIEDVLPNLIAFIGEDILVGHRVLFDFSFIKKAAVNMNLPFERKGIDTLKLARRFLPELQSKRLPFLCEYYGIPHKAHRAVNDARATAELYRRLAEEFPDETLYQPQPLIYKAKKDSLITKGQKEQLYKLIQAHKLVMDCDIDRLTKSEASRLADKIMLQYGRT